MVHTVSFCLNLNDALSNLAVSLQNLINAFEGKKTPTHPTPGNEPVSPGHPIPSSRQEELAEKMRAIIKDKFVPTQVIPRIETKYLPQDTLQYAQALQEYRNLNPNSDELKIFEYWQARMQLTEEWAKHSNMTIEELLHEEETSPEELIQNYQDLLDRWQKNEPTAQNQAQYFTALTDSNTLKTFFNKRLDDLKREVQPGVDEQEKLNELIEQIKAEVNKPDTSAENLESLGKEFAKNLTDLEEKYGLSEEEKTSYGYWVAYLRIAYKYAQYKNLSRREIIDTQSPKKWKDIFKEYSDLLDAFSKVMPRTSAQAEKLKINLNMAKNAKKQFETWGSNQTKADLPIGKLAEMIKRIFDQQGRYSGYLIGNKRQAITQTNYDEFDKAIKSLQSLQQQTNIMSEADFEVLENFLTKLEQNIGKSPTDKYKNTMWYTAFDNNGKLTSLAIDTDSLYKLAQQYNENIIDAYELLGVNPALPDVINRTKEVYKKLSLIYHPDKYKGNEPEKADTIMKALTKANGEIEKQPTYLQGY